MRQIILDTETTGLEPTQGHRIIEIGAVELYNRRTTGRHFHHYLQPDRDIDAGAMQVHGIRSEDLIGKPRFAEVAQEFLNFIRDAELVIHNAPFDVGFLNYEMSLLGEGYGPLTAHCTVLDTLVLARQLHPGQKNNLDALCKRYQIDNTHRSVHGALLDAQILAEVYLAMTGGQAHLMLDGLPEAGTVVKETFRRVVLGAGQLPVVRACAAEAAQHEARMAAIDKASGGRCLWRIDAT